MNLLRFIGLLFVFLGVLASCAVAVALIVLILRFWPVLLVVATTLGVFALLLRREGVRIDRGRSEPSHCKAKRV